MISEALVNNPLWALALCVIAGMLITGAVLLIAACMRSSQISRQEKRHGWKVGSWREWK